MEQSILRSVKKNLGIGPDATEFDHDILTYINSTFSTLHQLGIGPNGGFAIEDNLAVWADFIEQDPRYNQIQTYVCLKTRMLFDPPTTSYLIGAFDKQIEELEWRLNIQREGTAWADPDPDPNPVPDLLDIFGERR